MNYININNIQIGKLFNYGSEADIYETEYQNILYKKWVTKDLNTILNKVKKLELLEDRIEDIDFVVRAENIISDEYYTGYTMKLFEGFDFDPSSEGYSLNYEETVEVLIKLREIVLNLHERNIDYFDLNTSNILCKREEGKVITKLIDLDNIRIDNYNPDIYPSYLSHYLARGGCLNNNALIFSFNYLTRILLSYFDERLLGECNSLKYNKYIDRIVREIDENKHDCFADHEYLLDKYLNDDMTVKTL